MSRMIFENNYTAPSGVQVSNVHLNTPEDEYDFNFIFPVQILRSDRIELRPFVPSLYAKLLYDNVKKNPELLDYLPGMSVNSLDDVLQFLEQRRRDPTALVYAIFTGPVAPDSPPTDPKDYVFAGIMCHINASDVDMQGEPGFIIILPQFQRTHVLTHAAGTLIHRILDSTASAGLGLRRCQWFTNSLNVASQSAAIRLGFKPEGVLRCHRVLAPGYKGARPGRPGEKNADRMSRDSWLASITWQDWEDNVKKHIDRLMARTT